MFNPNAAEFTPSWVMSSQKGRIDDPVSSNFDGQEEYGYENLGVGEDTNFEDQGANKAEAEQEYHDESWDGDEETNMTPSEMLSAILPNLSAEVIEKELARHNYDLSATIADLLSDTAATPTTRAQKTAEDDKGETGKADRELSQSCRFFKQGYCARGRSCNFLHDSSCPDVCVFWLKGGCLKGRDCEFAHSVDGDAVAHLVELMDGFGTASSSEVSAPPPPPEVNDVKNFPTLGATATKRMPSVMISSQAIVAQCSDASSTQDFPSLKAAVSSKRSQKTRHEQVSHHDATFAARAKLRAGAPLTSNSSASMSGTRSGPVRTTKISSGTRTKDIPRLAVVSLPWTSTGGSVAKIYQETRAAAAEHARKRNASSARAGRLYLANDRAGARKWGEECRFHNEEMHRLHKQASRRIFAERNSGSGNGCSGRAFIDLHALHVEEGLGILEEQLYELQKEGRLRKVYVICGTGHHSSQSHGGNGRTGSRLAMAVTDYLDEEGYRYGDVSTDGLGGMIEVVW